jgi:hypothetical protein
MFIDISCEVIVMVTRRRKGKKTSKPAKKVSCICGNCDEPNPHLRGYLIMALGALFIPISFGFFPEFDFIAKGWPILLVLFGMVLVAQATLCRRG